MAPVFIPTTRGLVNLATVSRIDGTPRLCRGRAGEFHAVRNHSDKLAGYVRHEIYVRLLRQAENT